MGVGPVALGLYVDLVRDGTLCAGQSVLELGSQNFYPWYFEPKAIFEAFRCPMPDEPIESSRQLMAALGFGDYECIDIDGKYGAHKLDLNTAEYDEWPCVDLVTNHGTSEHCCNQANVFKFIHDATKVGGVMINIVPAHLDYAHCYFLYQPQFFRDLAETNGYETIRFYRTDDSSGALIVSVFRKVKNTIFQIPNQKPKAEEKAMIPEIRVKSCRHGRFMYYINDTYIGQSLDRYGEYSEQEVELFRQIIQPGMTVLDIGANIGCFTVPLSRMVGPRGRVMAIEAQKQVYQMLVGNLALNEITNTTVMVGAASNVLGNVRFPKINYAAPGNFGASRPMPDLPEDMSELIPTFPIDEMNITPVHFVKVDVEGMELEALQGMEGTIENNKPILYVENDHLDKSYPLIEFILGKGYRAFWHLPQLFNPKNHAGITDNAFTSIGAVNMLCVHTSVQLNISGLKEITAPDQLSGAIGLYGEVQERKVG